MRRALLAVAVLLGLIAASAVAVAATSSVSLAGGDAVSVTCPTALWKQVNSSSNWTVHCRKSQTPTPTPTSSSPAPSSSSSTPTPTSATPPPAGCTVGLNGVCGPYDYPAIPMSNGYNTYVANQNVGATSGTTQKLTATGPGDWSVTADDTPYGYTGVQTFPDVQQLTNDWCGGGVWGGCANPTDTPLSALASLTVNYTETGPADANSIYEFTPDVWSDYPSDVMFWVDTHGRCNEGAYGSTLLGQAVLDGQNWTVHRYGGAGAEIIFVLDGAGGSGTCAQQTSGTVNIKAGFDWLAAHGYLSNPQISQLNTGWEITSADQTTFTVSSYSISAG